jgi:hypothetical protein
MTQFKSHVYDVTNSVKGKGKANPAEGWTGPAGSRRLRFPYFMAHEEGKVVSFTYRPPLSPG